MIRLVRRFSELTKVGLDQVVRVSPQKQKSLDKTGFYSSSDIAIDTRDNPTLTKAMASKRVSVSDPDFKARAVDISQAQTLGKDVLQAELGTVKTYASHQILIDDVDPYNVPKDKEIIFSSQQAQVHAIGRLVEGSDVHGEGVIDSQIFVENATKDFWTWRHYLKLLPLLPVGYMLALYLQAVRDHFQVASFYRALDREDYELLMQIKSIPRTTVETVATLEQHFPNAMA